MLYFAPGNSHAPHHASKDWIAKFKGQFDQGWDKVREETLARQKKLGIAPENTVLTTRSEGIPAWDSLSADQKKVYARAPMLSPMDRRGGTCPGGLSVPCETTPCS